jgi:hypothetical protein
MSINTDHKKNVIETNDDSIISIGGTGGVLIGDGTNISPISNKGVVRLNTTSGLLEVSNGTSWQAIKAGDTTDNSLVYALIFGN